LANVRIRGKIPREEWPKIAARFHNGETLTEIGRSYNCTAPAIRYIVARTSTRGATAKKMGRDKLEKTAVIASAEYRRSTRRVRAEGPLGPRQHRHRDIPDRDRFACFRR